MSEQIKIRWGDLGPTTRPCEMDYYGKRVIVTARNIEAAKGNPDAVFTAVRSLVLPEQYFLGSVEVPGSLTTVHPEPGTSPGSSGS
jgi:hypothetical protein